MIFLQHYGIQSYLDDTKLVIPYKLKNSLNAFADLRDCYSGNLLEDG